jgi:hypothetical protein
VTRTCSSVVGAQPAISRKAAINQRALELHVVRSHRLLTKIERR